jgi:hypothetical protein
VVVVRAAAGGQRGPPPYCHQGSAGTASAR